MTVVIGIFVVLAIRYLYDGQGWPGCFRSSAL